jgi:hypothetical protein
MPLPFTIEQFFDVFTRYNAAIWPAQWAAHALGIASVVAAWDGGRARNVFVTLTLALFWAMAGGGYHLGFFRDVNPVALPAGVLFLAEAALLIWAAVHGRLAFRVTRAPGSLVGLVFVAYALVVYPVLNLASGHTWASSPAFGVAPCPVTIFTFGMYLLAERRVPAVLIPVPLLWSVVGLFAAVRLGVPADYGLGIAGVAGTAILVARSRRRVEAASAHA